MMRWTLGLVFLGLAPTLARAEVTLQDRQQAACYRDAHNLCGQFIPDAQKTEACMVTMKDRVSERCRAFYAE